MYDRNLNQLPRKGNAFGSGISLIGCALRFPHLSFHYIRSSNSQLTLHDFVFVLLILANVNWFASKNSSIYHMYFINLLIFFILQKYPSIKVYQLCIHKRCYRTPSLIDSTRSICMRLRFAVIYGKETRVYSTNTRFRILV